MNVYLTGVGMLEVILELVKAEQVFFAYTVGCSHKI